jgi:ABC-type sugar transport system ATPase subunit
VAAEPTAAPAPGVEILGLVKRYGDTVALAGLDLTAEAGRILGVAGPNGAGKSTLIKILAAEVAGDEGDIRIGGDTWSPSLADRRVAVVHQEPQLFPNLTVAENLLIGRERSRWRQHGIDERERQLLDDFAILEVADEPLGSQPLAVQQRTEIARALAQDTRVVLFDEPNSALTEEESDDLFRRMHGLADAGRTVILVSHRLSELAEHSDRVAVILDGRCGAVLEGEGLTADAIARTLVAGVGGAREHAVSAREEQVGAPALRVRGFGHRRGAFRDVDLEVPEGAIVALAGVEGSGARELVRAIAGFERTTGSAEIVGGEATRGLQDATAFVSADRASTLFSNMTVGENVVARLDDQITGGTGVLRRGRMESLGQELRERFQIKAESLDTPIRSLSGGNQQKVAIASAVVCAPRVLVLEEPTRGVDIGSKAEIYEILRGYAREGHAVVLYCTEMLEVFEVAARLYVVSAGVISEPVDVSSFADVEALAIAASALEQHARDRADTAAA